MALLFGLAAVGLLLLAVAADQLVVGAGRLATWLRISPVVVGVVVIGLGTSAPELLVSGLAAHRGAINLAVGNLIGSNILNLTFVLGIAALITPVAVRSSAVRREAPLSVAATALFALAVGVGLGLRTGVVLALGTVAAGVLLLRFARATPDLALPSEVYEFLHETPRRHVLREAARAVLGLAGTLAGAQLLVVNAGEIASRLGASEVVIGFTLVAIGTSLPELVTAVQAQRHGESDLLVGNLLGSNLMNSLAGGAVAGLAAGPGARGTAGVGLIVTMLMVSLLAWALLFRGNRVTRPEGLLLLAVYALALPLLA